MRNPNGFKNFALAAGFTILGGIAVPAYGAEILEAIVPMERDVVVAVKDAFIPSGFDTGSDAYVVVHGAFPNTCYQWRGGLVKNVNAVTHEIRSHATLNEGVCVMVMVPFTEEVQLGRLVAGKHEVRFMNPDGSFFRKELAVDP